MKLPDTSTKQAPTVLSVLLLLVGSLAIMATSATRYSVTSGEVLESVRLDRDNPVVRVELDRLSSVPEGGTTYRGETHLDYRAKNAAGEDIPVLIRVLEGVVRSENIDADYSELVNEADQLVVELTTPTVRDEPVDVDLRFVGELESTNSEVEDSTVTLNSDISVGPRSSAPFSLVQSYNSVVYRHVVHISSEQPLRRGGFSIDISSGYSDTEPISPLEYTVLVDNKEIALTDEVSTIPWPAACNEAPCEETVEIVRVSGSVHSPTLHKIVLDSGPGVFMGAIFNSERVTDGEGYDVPDTEYENGTYLMRFSVSLDEGTAFSDRIIWLGIRSNLPGGPCDCNVDSRIVASTPPRRPGDGRVRVLPKGTTTVEITVELTVDGLPPGVAVEAGVDIIAVRYGLSRSVQPAVVVPL